MITLSVDWFLTIVILLFIVIIIGFSFAYDHFEVQQYAKRCAHSLFYCKKCNCITSINDKIEFYKCARCGTKNACLKF